MRPFKSENIELFPEEELEFEIVVRISPLKRETAKMRVKNIRKATLGISEPEEI